MQPEARGHGIARVTVVPASSVPWEDVERVFGTRGDASRCWCQYFKAGRTDAWFSSFDDVGADVYRDRLRDQCRNGTPGLLAYVGDEPVGWCAVEPRPAYPGLLRTRVLRGGSAEPAGDPAVWAVTCFVVRVGFRRAGVARALVAAAVPWAREHGALVLEGYPVDPAERSKTSAASLYHGTVSLFTSAGFGVESRPAPGRAVVRLELGT